MTCLCIETLTQEDRDKAQLIAISLGYRWSTDEFNSTLSPMKFDYLLLYSVSEYNNKLEHIKNLLTWSHNLHPVSTRTGEPVIQLTIEELSKLPPIKR